MPCDKINNLFFFLVPLVENFGKWWHLDDTNKNFDQTLQDKQMQEMKKIDAK